MPALPQTNLQLYRLLMERPVADADLALARRGYDLARQLFSQCYRPSHKPFMAHLVGTAGALARWGEPIETVVAGMLHSAYLFGDFGDGRRGATEWRRKVIRRRIGAAVEQLIYGYTTHSWKAPLEQTAAAVMAGKIDRTAVVIKLADLCDECCDAGPHFAVGKPLEFGLPADQRSRQLVLELVEQLAGAAAREHFTSEFALLDGCRPPASLQSADRSFHAVGGLPERSDASLIRRLHRFAQYVRGKRVA